MQKFLVLYMTPFAMMQEWMKTSPAERKTSEEKMKAEWDTWLAAHKDIFVDMGGGTGGVKRLTKGGTSDAHNDIMLYAVIQAESADAAAKMFADHPHFGIPEATIEIMPIKPLS